MILSTENHGNVRRGYEPEIGVFATVSFIGSFLCDVGSLYFFEPEKVCDFIRMLSVSWTFFYIIY